MGQRESSGQVGPAWRGDALPRSRAESAPRARTVAPLCGDGASPDGAARPVSGPARLPRGLLSRLPGAQVTCDEREMVIIIVIRILVVVGGGVLIVAVAVAIVVAIVVVVVLIVIVIVIFIVTMRGDRRALLCPWRSAPHLARHLRDPPA